MKDLDKFEMILQAYEYEQQAALVAAGDATSGQVHPLRLDDFFASTAGKIKCDAVRSWEAALLSLRASQHLQVEAMGECDEL